MINQQSLELIIHFFEYYFLYLILTLYNKIKFTTVFFCIILYYHVLTIVPNNTLHYYIMYINILRNTISINVWETHGKAYIHFFRVLIYCIYLASNITGGLLDT